MSERLWTCVLSACLIIGGVLAVGNAAPAPPKDPARALLSRAIAATKRVRSLRAEVVMSLQEDGHRQTSRGTMQLLRPNFARFALTTAGQPELLVSTGTDTYIVHKASRQYEHGTSPMRGEELFQLGSMSSPIGCFYDPEILSMGKAAYLGTQQRNGQTHRVIEITTDEAPKHRRLFLGPSGLVEGLEATEADGASTTTYSMWLLHIHLGGLVPQRFAYQPPADYQVVTQAASPELERTLLSLRSTAPDARLFALDGTTLSVSSLLRDRKVLLVTFWFYG